MPRKVLVLPESSVTFSENGTITFTIKNVASGAGRVSAQWDRGVNAIAMRYHVEVKVTTASNVTPGTAGVRAEPYLCSAHSNAANVDSAVGQSDAALSSLNQLLGALPLPHVLPTGTGATTGPFYSSCDVELYARYISVALWNLMGVNTANTNDATVITLTPMPDQIQ